jgi:ribose transport system permease protein
MKTISRQGWRQRMIKNQWFFLLLVVIALSATATIVNPRYFSIRNLRNLLEQISVLGLLASGATILIISGNFDISVGANLGLSACVIGLLIRSGVPPAVSGSVGILVAVAGSSFVGGAALLFKAPSFIISLAGISVFQGLALALTGGTLQTIYGEYETLGSTRFFGVLPLLFVIGLSAYFLVHCILTRTQLGRRVYAIGDNKRAAFLAGIHVNRNTMGFFVLNGFFVGVAALLMIARVGAAQPSTGAGMELQAIGSVVIGGAPMTGGRGSILGTFFGVLLWGVVANSLNMMRVNPYFQQVTIGLLIIVAVAVSSLRSHAEGKLGG